MSKLKSAKSIVLIITLVSFGCLIYYSLNTDSTSGLPGIFFYVSIILSIMTALLFLSGKDKPDDPNQPPQGHVIGKLIKYFFISIGMIILAIVIYLLIFFHGFRLS